MYHALVRTNRLDDFKIEILPEGYLITTCTYIIYTNLQDRCCNDIEKYNFETTRCHDISVFHITASWYLNKRPIKILNLTKNNSDLVEVPKKGEKEQKSPF